MRNRTFSRKKTGIFSNKTNMPIARAAFSLTPHPVPPIPFPSVAGGIPFLENNTICSGPFSISAPNCSRIPRRNQMEKKMVKEKATALRGIRKTKLAVLWLGGVFSWTALALPQARADDTRGVQEDSFAAMPLALSGTELLRQTENVQGVDGNPANMIDQKQYSQIQDYFLKQIANSPSKRDRLWQPVFSSPAAYTVSIVEHRQHLEKMLGLVELRPQAAQVRQIAEAQGTKIEELTIEPRSRLRSASSSIHPGRG